MKLVIVHHHLRPGGVRRVMDLGATHLAEHWPGRLAAVVLATGEAPERDWLREFRQRLFPTPVEAFVEPAFGYTSEGGFDARTLGDRVREGLARLLATCATSEVVVWAHNPGLGRNLYLSRELALACQSRGIRVVMHHHDWWFENRWHHFTALDEPAFRRLPAVARAILADSPSISHVAINRADARVLERHFPKRSGWLPNPGGPSLAPPMARLKATRRWLGEQLGGESPVWLVPCRLLRRKNLAEALLLMRWLRPEAWLITTGGVSSVEEQRYAEALAAAATAYRWPMRLGILEREPAGKPSVPELLAASEAVLLTSLHEGFGLPYVEASAAQRPLLARRLRNIAPDLRTFGFAFPQAYWELRVDPTLFDWHAERDRQRQRFAAWKRLMPAAVRRLVGTPALLGGGTHPRPMPFSRLTLTAQLEVLAQPIEVSWARCRPLNPFLASWRRRAQARRLQVSPWPVSATRWLGGAAYARRFLALLPGSGVSLGRANVSLAAQRDFLRAKLTSENLYPLLWTSDP